MRFPICSKHSCICDVDFLNASRFPVRDSQAMSFKHKIGNLILSLAMSILYFRWVRDSQSGMWVFRRSILKDMKLVADGMAFSEEIKIEALKEQPRPLRRNFHHVHLAAGRNQIESVARRILQPVVPGQEAIFVMTRRGRDPALESPRAARDAASKP